MDVTVLPTRRGRPKSVDEDARRHAILRAAHAVFVEDGFERATTAAIAARAKVSKRSIYENFADKAELFAAIIRGHQHLILDLPRPPGEDVPVLETMVRLFRLDIGDEEEHAREAILNLVVRESVLFPDLSDYLYENEVIRSREALMQWLQAEHRRGRMPSGDLAVHAGMLMDIVFGALLPRRRLLHAADRVQRREHIKQRLAIFLRGIQE
jgi:AcrR family transcriptional regulator